MQCVLEVPKSILYEPLVFLCFLGIKMLSFGVLRGIKKKVSILILLNKCTTIYLYTLYIDMYDHI